MKRILFLLMFLFAVRASAQIDAFNGYCTQGSYQVLTSNLPSSNLFQNLIPLCQVTVYLTGTTTKATIFQDANSTPLTNPFTASTKAQWLFFAADGQGYDVVMSGGIPPITYSIPVTLTDLKVGGGGGGTGVTSVSCGNLNPLFNCSVANPGTTPALSFTLQNAGATSILGNFTGSTGPPFYATYVCTGLISCPYDPVSNTWTLNVTAAAGLTVTTTDPILVNGSHGPIATGTANISCPTCVPTIIQVNATPTTPTTPVNYNNTTPPAPTGYTNVKWQQDGSANISAYVPNVAQAAIDMQPQGLPVGLHALIYPTGANIRNDNARSITITDGVTATNGAPSTIVCSSVTWQGTGVCPNGSIWLSNWPVGFPPALGRIQWTFTGALEAQAPWINPANITAVYAFIKAGWNGYGAESVDCSSTMNVFAGLSYDQNTLLAGTAVDTRGCTAQISDSGSNPFDATYSISLIGLAVYYNTDPAPPADNSLVVDLPLTIINGHLGMDPAFPPALAGYQVGSLPSASANFNKTYLVLDYTSNTVSGACTGGGNFKAFAVPSGGSWTCYPFGGGGGGSVSITSAAGGLTVSPSPLTGTGTIDLNLAHANTWTATQTLSGLILSGITGSTQCLHVDSSGVVSGTGLDCGSGGSAFSSLTSGTNTSAAMLVGSGASLAPTGTGTIQANDISSTITAGANVTITGAGTVASPYVINSSGGGGAVAWNAITNPTGNQALTMAANTTTFTFNAATGSGDLFKWTDTASNTGIGILGHFATASGSTEIPWQADANGIGWQVDTTGRLVGVGSSTSHGITMPSGTQLTGAAGFAVLTTDSNAKLYLSENGGSLGEVCTSVNGVCGGSSATVGSAEVVAFSATPTFSSSFNVSRIVLTGNITSFTMGGSPADGQDKTLCFKQGSGPYTVAAPAAVHGFFTIGTVNATWNCQTFVWDNTDSIWMSVGPGTINQ